MSAGSGSGFGSAGVTDRISADIAGQANMIRAKIQECQMQYFVNSKPPHLNDCGSDAFPCSDQDLGTAVKDLTCPNDPLTGGGAEQSLWNGPRLAMLPPPTKGFAAWMYMNGGDAGGRCIWTSPTAGNANTSEVEGLFRAGQKFTDAERSYNHAGATQKFVIMLTLPTTGPLTPNCAP